MNSLFVLLGIESWKPLLTALVLPPVPLLLLVLVGARLLLVRRTWGWVTLGLSVLALWLSMCSGVARLLESALLELPAPLSPQRIAQLRADAPARNRTAIVVLGGGAEPFAPEYGTSNLLYYSLERLHYGVWLARETGLPLAFSGGIGWGSRHEAREADAAARIAAEDFRWPLRWAENQSRDTHENAVRTVALLKRSGVTHLLLVTHDWHMPRALHQFQLAARAEGITVEAAPMGLARWVDSPVLQWVPSNRGYVHVRNVLHEWLGRRLGA